MVYTPGRKPTHCSYCGAAFAERQHWPRDCSTCGETTWGNPLPVAVVLAPVRDSIGNLSLVVIRRAIPPAFGEWALPGGYMELGENWRQAAVRELREESGITAAASDVELFDVDDSPSTLQVFALVPVMPATQLPSAVPTGETLELDLLDGPTQLAFATHTSAVHSFFRRRGGSG